MKTEKIILILLIFLNFVIIGQTKTTNKTVTKQEIDLLAEKYKDKPTLTLYTTYGDLNVDSEVKYNDDGKPQAVIVFGSNSNEEATQEFLLKTINQKKKQGYKFVSKISFGHKFADEGLSSGGVLTYKKGNMYFLVKPSESKSYIITQTSFNQLTNKFDTEKIWETYPAFEIETGDNSRKGGKNATKFEF